MNTMNQKENSNNLICPKCSSRLETFARGLNCSNQKCTFWIPREIRQKVLTPSIIKELIENGKTRLIDGFHKRGSSQTFSAILEITKEWKITIRLKDQEKYECPKCKGILRSFERGYKCSNEHDCGYVLWNRYSGKELSQEQLHALLLNKRTKKISGFKRKKDGKLYSAEIVMDESGSLSLDFGRD